MGIVGLKGDPSQDQCLKNFKNWCKLLSLNSKKVETRHFL